MPRIITMNWIDWVTVALVLVSGVRGARYGFWVVLFDGLSVVASFLVAAALYTEGGPMVTPYLPAPTAVTASWGEFVAFVVVWAVIYFPLSRIARILLRDVPFPASEITGALLGAARGFVLAAALLVVALAAPFHATVQRDADNSLTASYLLGLDDAAMHELPKLPVQVPRIGPGGKMF